MSRKSNPRPATPWRLEFVLAAGLLGCLAAGFAVELRGPAKAGDLSLTQGQSSGRNPDGSSTDDPGAGIVPKVGLVCPPGSGVSTEGLRKALKDINIASRKIPLDEFRTMDLAELDQLDVLFLISRDDLEIDFFGKDLDLARRLARFARRGGVVVGSTSWSLVIFYGPFQPFNLALNSPVRWEFDGPSLRAHLFPMKTLSRERKRDELEIARWDADVKDWNYRRWRFDGQRTPDVEFATLKKNGIDVWCYATRLNLPIVVSQRMESGFVVYSALGDYRQNGDGEARELLRFLVDLGPSYRRTTNGQATGARPTSAGP